jgi:hypothetical protein
MTDYTIREDSITIREDSIDPADQILPGTVSSIEPLDTLNEPHNPTGDAVAQFALDHLNQQVGTGECTDLAAAALQYANAQRPDTYVWGTEITQRPPEWGTWQKGDIIQFWDAQFKWTENGATHTWGVGPTGRHTAIIGIATFTNEPPWNAWLLNQNDGVRSVTWRRLYLHHLVSGQFIVYRPIPV